jgi:succinate-semialdehyde dehydrogenase / glutarate-semialdehyde dehydrogenase
MTRTLTARNPRTGAQDFAFQAADGPDVQQAAARLRANQKAWAAKSLEERCAVLEAFRQAILRHAGPIAAALEIDTGRRKIAGIEVQGVAGGMAGWIAQTPHLLHHGWTQGRTMASVKHAVQWEPFKLVGVISPWNFPFLLSFIDATPALLSGGAVMIKPSEVTPRWVAPVLKALQEVPELEAVLTILQGDGQTGQAVIDAVDAICFTGSVATGRKVGAQCAGRFIPAFLELGGKDPLVILASADLDKAVTAALRGSVLSTGQACQSIERIYVQRGLYPAFVEKLTAAAAAARLNWPDIAAGEIGPLIFDRQAAIIQAHLQDAVQKGAHIETGGAVETHGGGLWVRPTVLTNVDHSMAVMTEETFGPIMPVMAFDTAEEAVALANDTSYGLSAAVMAGTLEEAEAVGRQIDAGAVSLNDAAMTALYYEAPHESFKLSGLGRSRMGAPGFQRFFREKGLIAQTGAPIPLAAFAEDAVP